MSNVEAATPAPPAAPPATPTSNSSSTTNKKRKSSAPASYFSSGELATKCLQLIITNEQSGEDTEIEQWFLPLDGDSPDVSRVKEFLNEWQAAQIGERDSLPIRESKQALWITFMKKWVDYGESDDDEDDDEKKDKTSKTHKDAAEENWLYEGDGRKYQCCEGGPVLYWNCFGAKVEKRIQLSVFY